MLSLTFPIEPLGAPGEVINPTEREDGQYVNVRRGVK